MIRAGRGEQKVEEALLYVLTGRVEITPLILDLIETLKDDTPSAREMAARVLADQVELSEDTILELANLLEDDH